MPLYLESLDGSQSYRADMFCGKRDLVNGHVYMLDEIDFSDWLKVGNQHKPPQKKLKAVWYGPQVQR